jgi:hypothetical protein
MSPTQRLKRDAVSDVPLVQTVLFCVAIVLLIAHYTCKARREHRDAVASGRLPQRGTSSWTTTGSWVRQVRRESAKKHHKRSSNKRVDKASSRKRGTSVTSSSGYATLPRSVTTQSTSEDTDNTQSSRLATIEEEDEVELHTPKSKRRSRTKTKSKSASPQKGRRHQRASSSSSPMTMSTTCKQDSSEVLGGSPRATPHTPRCGASTPIAPRRHTTRPSPTKGSPAMSPSTSTGKSTIRQV